MPEGVTTLVVVGIILALGMVVGTAAMGAVGIVMVGGAPAGPKVADPMAVVVRVAAKVAADRMAVLVAVEMTDG
jgi:hypothetical protein